MLKQNPKKANNYGKKKKHKKPTLEAKAEGSKVKAS